MSAGKPKKAPTGDYAVGYAKPPKAKQFQPGKSGNPSGRPRGRPSLDEIILEEAARIVKMTAGDKVTHIDRDRALVRKLFERAFAGDMRAMQLLISLLSRAQTKFEVTEAAEAPLTEEEVALLAMMSKPSGS
jgi:hypothetical protein